MSKSRIQPMKLVNRVVKAILASPFHKLLSGSTLVIQVTGKHSGKKISTPVNYIQEGNYLWIGSQRERTWWKNTRGGANGKVLLKGQWQECHFEAIEKPEEVKAAFEHFFQLNPKTANYYRVSISPEGVANADELAKCSLSFVMICATLLQPSEGVEKG